MSSKQLLPVLSLVVVTAVLPVVGVLLLPLVHPLVAVAALVAFWLLSLMVASYLARNEE